MLAHLAPSPVRAQASVRDRGGANGESGEHDVENDHNSDYCGAKVR